MTPAALAFSCGLAAGPVTWEAPRLLPLVIALVVVTCGGVVVLYVPQARGLRRRWRWAVVALRLSALAALATSVLRPTLTREPRGAEQGAVVIVVDRSRSMSVRDRQRDAAQLVALADGLGYIAPGLRARLDDVLRDAATVRGLLREFSLAQGELQNARISGRNTAPAEARLAEAAARLDPATRALAGRRASVKGTSALADALGRAGQSLDGPRDATRDEAWAAAFAARLDQVAAAADAYQAETDRALFERDAGVRLACRELRGLSRLGLAEQAVARPGAGLLDRLAGDVPVFGFAVAEDVAPLPLRGRGGRAVRHLLLTPDGTASGLPAALREVMARLAGVPVQAVVVFSDGRAAAGTDPGGAASEPFATPGVPIFAVPLAPAAPGRDAAIAQLAAPERAFVGEEITVRARVRGTALRGASLDVTCLLDPDPSAPLPGAATAPAGRPTAPATIGAADTWHKRVTLGNDDAAELEFPLRIATPGAHRVVVAVAPLPNELTTENNAAEARVTVLTDPTTVTFVADAPGWDFRRYRAATAAAPGFGVDSYVLAGGELPLSPRDIAARDVLVLDDVDPRSLQPGQWGAVRQVLERGGAAVLLAGPEHLPSQYGTPLLGGLLPSNALPRQAWQTWPGDQPPYALYPDAGSASEAADALRLADLPAASRRRWDSLSSMFTYLPVTHPRAEAAPLLAERETGAAVVTVHPLGHGRVLFVGARELWRWGYKGATDQDRLWLQLLRQVAEQPYASTVRGPGGASRSLDVARPAIQPGQAVRVRARLIDADGSPSIEPRVDVRLCRGAETVRVFPLAVVGVLGSGRYEGTLTGVASGDYVLQLARADGPPGCALHVAPWYVTEVADVSGDAAALGRLAEASGGEVVPLDQVNQLPARLAARQAGSPRGVPVRLWDSEYLFLLVVGCLSAEWAIRKQLGLA